MASPRTSLMLRTGGAQPRGGAAPEREQSDAASKTEVGRVVSDCYVVPRNSCVLRRRNHRGWPSGASARWSAATGGHCP
eukprot:4933622-Prymnesium_polylepis.1